MSTFRHTLLILAMSCSSSTSPDQAGSGSVATTGSGSAYSSLGKKPEGARRPTPPPEIEKRAPALGATAPAIDLAIAAGTASGGRWTLADALSKRDRVMLVFYRGDW
jgi:hypothetical protein